MRRVGFAALALALALLRAAPAWAGGAAGADVARDSEAGTPGPFVAALVVNGRDRGAILMALVGADVYVATAALATIGDAAAADSALPSAVHLKLGGVEFVKLSSLARPIGARFDERSITLDVRLGASSLGSSAFDLGERPPADLERTSVPSATLDYTLDATSGSRLGAFLDGVLSDGGGRYFESTASRLGNGAFARGLTSFTLDLPGRIQSFALGDAAVETGPLGGSVVLAGLTSRRDYSLNPYVVNYSRPSLSGTALMPETAQVFVNGQLVEQTQLEPGNFRFDNLPGVPGTNSSTVVLRDAQGNITTIGGSAYVEPSLLRRGATDYDAGLGFLRPRPFSDDDRYARDAVLARASGGLTDALTIGGRFEGTAGLVSGGLSADAKLPFGVVGVEEGLSRANGIDGTATLASLSYRAPAFSVAAAAARRSDGYANLSTGPHADRVTDSLAASASANLAPALSLSASSERDRDRDLGTSSHSSLDVDLRLGAGRTFQVELARGTAPAGPSASLLARLTLPMGALARVTTAYGNDSPHDEGSGRVSTSFERDAPAGPGVGYVLTADTRDGHFDDYAGFAEVRSPYVDATLTRTRLTGETSSSAELSGTIGGAAGHLFASEPVGDSFALVRASGVAAAAVSRNGVDVGTTDGSGYLVVPNLQPYAANAVAIETLSLPFDVTLDRMRADVAPPYRGASLVDFRATRIRSFVGTIRVRLKSSATVVPADAELELKAGAASMDMTLGDDGDFYFPALGAGHYSASIKGANTSCAFQLNVPKTDAVQTDLGVIACDES